MTEETEKRMPPLPALLTEPVKRPPHPLDGQWHIHLNDETYGPYTGHEMQDFVKDGTIDGATSVIRVGGETWTKAGEDAVLSKVFRTPKPAPPPANVTAAKGATIVQVTNQIMPSAIPHDIFDGGPAGPKSPGIALLLSFLFCGAGQMYNGQVAKGILMMIGCIVLWFVLFGWIINIWSWIDAYQTAKNMNARYQHRLINGMMS